MPGTAVATTTGLIFTFKNLYLLKYKFVFSHTKQVTLTLRHHIHSIKNIDKLTSKTKISNQPFLSSSARKINKPTHYMENSSSLIDLILTSNRNIILLSGVGEPFLEQNIRYHCPVFCVLIFSKPLAPLYKRRVFTYDRGNYQAFSNDLVQTDWQTLKSENINTYAENIIERITTLANKHVPNWLINARKTDPAWFTTQVKKLIRKRKDHMTNTRNLIILTTLKHTNSLQI